MFMIERILCPVDFSAPSRAGLRYGAFFAARYQARLYVLHVLDLGGHAGHEWRPMEEAELRGRVGEFVAEASLQVPAEAEVRTGKAFVEIIRFARERDVDLIVLCAHGHGGGHFPWIGSTAERVVRKSPCPVLTVHPQPGSQAGGPS